MHFMSYTMCQKRTLLHRGGGYHEMNMRRTVHIYGPAHDIKKTCLKITLQIYTQIIEFDLKSNFVLGLHLILYTAFAGIHVHVPVYAIKRESWHYLPTKPIFNKLSIDLCCTYYPCQYHNIYMCYFSSDGHVICERDLTRVS